MYARWCVFMCFADLVASTGYVRKSKRVRVKAVMGKRILEATVLEPYATAYTFRARVYENT